MSKRFIDGTEFTAMVFAAAERLNAGVQRVNALNVFPVPDGDTGTNMNLTLTSGVDELRKRPSVRIGQAAETLARGLLMGARGNSGVILSQLFRGFAKSVSALEKASSTEFAQALQQGVETAYAAVVRPVEGTILTVSKEAAKAAVNSARRTAEVDAVMRDTLKAANEALARTPELLPVLKQVGVVDSGGQGLVLVYEGFLAALTGEAIDGPPMQDGNAKTDYSVIPAEVLQKAKKSDFVPVQAHMETESIEHGYCTEFIVRLTPGGRIPGLTFDEPDFRRELETMGDSLLVVADEDLVKIHIHAEYPGEVMNFAMQYGDLTRIKIENMREQHSHIISQDYGVPAAVAAVSGGAQAEDANLKTAPKKPYGMIVVAAGEGLSEIFTSLGVDYVLAGGQTMNPSTEDILNAVEQVNAEHIFVFPNNSNIIMAAGQARDLAETPVFVIPTKSIQQGLAAVLAFQENEDVDRNAQMMEQAAKRVKSGQVTHAVRDTSIDDIEIREGEYIGILDGKIVVSNPDLFTSCSELLRSMLEGGEEIVSIITGADAEDAVTDQLAEFMRKQYPNAEFELLPGGQPVYSYLFSAE
ncbi:DAK2 domain-containing protein [Paenibacillus alkalitolerans]|uniref:DAK2 domain-containing protein n=1 Tax=Paenibacillus alkalitolerans TaxID=2799335 RepID=UPI0018F43C83|nr:DAK2 domain-containing protein [Paenibacillus alkalitolerans]